MTVKEFADGRPPYISFSGFTSFIARLKGSAIPSRIDRSLLSNMSGDAQAQLRSGLRFLRLAVGDDHIPTESLRRLLTRPAFS